MSPEEAQKPVKHQWFLPHHPVVNPNKPGKVRRVCDGPDLLNPLIGILMRFREERIALSADIEAMFSQVAVPSQDQVALRFLWRKDRNSPPTIYQFLRHVFGAKSSPMSANYVLQQTARDNREDFPKAAETVLKNFYMDDLFKSEADEDNATQLQGDLTKLLSRGGFRLTKWSSNSRQVLRHIPENELAPSLKGLEENGSLPIERALGTPKPTLSSSDLGLEHRP